MSMESIIREEARLVILRALNQQPDGRLNSELLRQALETYGITRSRDYVHEELRWLAEIGAIQVTEAGSVRIASLSSKGRDHAERRIVLTGVKRPSPEA